MPVTRRAQPGHVKWTEDGFTPAVAEIIEKCFRTLFVDMATTDFIDADRGGTGITSYTAGDILYADATATLTTLAIGAEGQLLRVSSSSLPAWSTLTIPDTAAQGGIPYATTANVLAFLAKSATATRYLANTGSNNNPAWDTVNLTNGVAGILPIANGGTNKDSYTSGSILYFDGTRIQEDNAGLYFDAGNNKVGIGVGAAPTETLDIRGATPDIGLRHAAASDYASFRFYEGSTQKAIIQHVGSSFADATRQDDLEIFTLAAGADVAIYINSAITSRFTTAGQTIVTGKTLTLTDITAGSVLFAGASGVVSQDNTNLFWDDTNNNLRIGAAAPGAGTLAVVLGDGTALGSMGSNTCGIFGEDVGGTVELYAINEANNVAQLTGLNIRKTADETITNSTAHQADDHLTVNLAASSSYEFEIYGFWTTAGATAGITVQLDGTAGVSSLKADVLHYINTSDTFTTARITAFNSPVGVAGTGDNSFSIKGVIEVSTAGTLFLEWAQNSADAVNGTVVQENSFFVLRKLNA